MPESPRQLYILNKDPAGAKESLKYYRGDNANVTEILEEYDDEVLSQKQIKRHSLLQIIKHPYLRQIFCHVIVLRLLHVFTLDINLGPYLQIIIERYGGSPTLAPTVALAMQSTGIIASFWAVVLFAIFKRKQIIMFTSTLTLISYLMMIVAEMSVDPEKQSNTSLGFLIAATMIDKAASGAGRSMTAIIVISDVCPVHSKDAIINAVTFSFYCVLALSSSIYFNMLNTYGIFVYIAGFLIILAINIYLVIFLPETKEKSINQIFDGYQELD
uniref:MFS domain-containing protein n=1 Tax=Rhabditophanes sp. KR3021 TaxID=114890 RepID=A0AC35UDR8_9BILA